MKGIIRFFKKLFGKYENGYEYVVKLNDIIISSQFQETPPRLQKMSRKWAYYRRTGKLESPILLKHDFVLSDGYTSYLIAKKQGLDKVPVYFVD